MKKYMSVSILAATLILGGCHTLGLGADAEYKRQSASSSLVDYLYPDGTIPPPYPEQLPYLQLPLRVGIAFVPSNHHAGFSAVAQEELLERVAEAFADRPFVGGIEVISGVYLRSAKGLNGMQQIARMHSVDVMALVSYDQIAISGERDSALLYWTIVGALVVKGNTNEVQTLIDTAVFDANTARLLMRAPGVDVRDANTTMVDNARDLRHLQDDGFSAATDAMIGNLELELETLRDQIKEGRRAQVAWRDGHSGGGIGGGYLLPGCLLLLLSLRRCKRLASAS